MEESAMKEAIDNCETCKGEDRLEHLCDRCKGFLELLGCYPLQLKKLSTEELLELREKFKGEVFGLGLEVIYTPEQIEKLYSVKTKLKEVRDELRKRKVHN